MIKIKPMASSIKAWLYLSWDKAKKSPCRPLNMAHLYQRVPTITKKYQKV